MAKSKDMYSWWWDSHISPKNSKWLQENLTDMDSKVKVMIKLIEVDEDSFARRAEMYYKKRPELMKLVEEFYRAYRALAERYDHATGVIRQAHKTMAEAFPNQVPFLMNDDGPVNGTHDSGPRTPEMQAPTRASQDPDELQKGAVGLSSSDLLKANGNFSNESDALTGKKGSKQLNGLGKARKGLNFQEVENRTVKEMEKQHDETQSLSDSDRLGRSETDIQSLKEALSKLEAEKEAGLLKYQQTLERLSKVESEVSQAKEDSSGLNERASKAEAQVECLKEALEKVEAERGASLIQYQQCLDRVSNLESHISQLEEDAGSLEERACKAEREAEVLKDELSRLKAEKEALLAKYMESLEKIANLENKLLLAEDYASRASERADRAEKEIENLRETIVRLTEEKEAAVLKHEECLAKIATLEREIVLIQEESERLKVEVEDGVAKLKGSEEQCLLLDRSNKSLESKVECLEQKVGFQNQELSEKQKELGRLWTCVQEERMRFMEAETAFQTLQNFHSNVQDELRSVATELHKNVQLLKDLEDEKQNLEAEVLKVKDENKDLNDRNLSSAASVRSMEEQIFDLKEGKEKLEQEVELGLDQRNALQQELYCLKEEINSLSQKHQDVVRQVDSVGYDSESFGSSVKELQDENSKLKESCQSSETELASVKEKLKVMENLVEKNELLEISLSNLNAELEAARKRVKELEESFHMLLGEKSTLVAEKGFLISQLQITTENLEKLSEHNTFLENSLYDANAELDMLRIKSKNLEDSCKMLDGQNTFLITEKLTLTSELETTHSKLEELGRRHADLELRFTGLEEERESTLQMVQELQSCLDNEKQEHAKSIQLNETQIADLENQIHLLQEVGDHMREEFEEELDKAVNAQFEIFILRKSIHDLKDNNSSLLRYSERLLEASRLSEKLILELEKESLDKQDEVRVLSGQVQGLRTGILYLLDALETDAGSAGDDYNGDQRAVSLIHGKVGDIKESLYRALDENQELVIEKSVFLAMMKQLKQDVTDLNVVIHTLRQEVEIRNGEVVVLQKEIQKLLESNEELILKVREGSQKEVALLTEVEDLREKLFDLQGAFEDLQKENCKVIEEKGSLMKAFEDLEEEKHNLADENSCMVEEVVTLDNLSFIFKKVISEKSKQVIELTWNIDKLFSDNNILEGKVKTVERKLEDARSKNFSFELSLKKSENELNEVKTENDELKDEIANEKNLLVLKEKELLDVESMKEDREIQVLELSKNYAEQLKECEELHELIQNLDSQIFIMQKEREESEARIRVLNAELQKGKDEIRLWETVAGTFFTELQSSSVREALIKEKFSELLKAYEVLEEESNSRCVDIVQLKERVGTLEGENSEIKGRLAADLSAIMSLKDSLASLEKQANWQRKNDKTDNEGVESYNQNLSEDQPVVFVDLHDIQSKVQDVEKAVIELKQQAEEENSNVRSELDSALRQIEALKSQSSSRRGSGRLSRRVASLSEENKPRKTSPDVSPPEEELLMKDIMLDQVSDCSSYGKNRKVVGSDDQILELWETIDQAGSIDLMVGKSSRAAPAIPDKYSHLESVKESRSGRPSIESMVEKELRVDDQQLTAKRSLNPEQEDNKRKTLERLASDVQKLTNLQITVQDLKEKLETTEKSSSKGKGVECESVKDQLLESENTILKLFEYSAKLMKNIENSSTASSFDGSVTADSSEGGSGKRRRCLEQARRISEKIGRLQHEVQKLQFLLMKLDSNKVGRGGTRVAERSTRVLLRDYLYGGSRTPRRRKRTHFCGCVQPHTRGD